MPTSLETMLKILDVTSFAELRLSAENQLEVRGSLKTAFQKLSDHFAAKSASGRAALAQRNERLLAALEQMVNEAKSADIDTDSLRSSRYGQLNTKLNTLRELSRSRRDASLNDSAEALKAMPECKALTESEQKILANIYKSMAKDSPIQEWGMLKNWAKELFFLDRKPEFQAMPAPAQAALLKASQYIDQNCPLEDRSRLLKAMQARFFFDLDPQAMAGKLKDSFTSQFCDPETLTSLEGYRRLERNTEGLESVLSNAALKAQNGKMGPDLLDTMREKMTKSLKGFLRGAAQSGLNPSEADLRNTLTNQVTSFNGSILVIADDVQLPSAEKEAFLEQVAQILDEIAAPCIAESLTTAMNLNGTHINLAMDASRGMLTHIGSTPVTFGLDLNTDVYASQLRRELGDVAPGLIPFISAMATQQYMGKVISEVPSRLEIPFLTDIATDGIRETNESKMSIAREGREILIRYSGTRDCFKHSDMSKGLFQMRAGATMRIQLDSARQAEGLPEGFLLPDFTIEDVTLDIVPLEAHVE